MTTHATGPRLSVSTWSLRRTLGDPTFYSVAQEIPIETHDQGALTLLDLPESLADFGIHTLEICHFHLPSVETSYLQELRSALERSRIELFSLLVDGGDITHPTESEENVAWIARWLDIAQALGAKRMRVSAGRENPSNETLALSIKGLRHLSQQANGKGVRLMTENWHDLLSTPEAVHSVFEQLKGEVGLCLDFGNWTGSGKYDALTSIASYAESCHAKAEFSPQYELNKADYIRCLEITRAASFSGPYTLIYSGPNDNEWDGLDVEREVVRPYLQKNQEFPIA